MNKKTTTDNSITNNKKARHDYFIEDTLEAGMALEGWEVKSLRAGRVQINDSHAIIRRSEIFLLGGVITPLPTASTHRTNDPTRTRKLLLHRKEINKLIGLIERKGYTLVPLKLYWKRGKVKLLLGLAKGKKQHDKRQSLKEKDWQRDKQRILKNAQKG